MASPKGLIIQIETVGTKIVCKHFIYIEVVCKAGLTVSLYRCISNYELWFNFLSYFMEAIRCH